MKTKGEISTISYNSEAWLVDRLNQLIKAHKISDYAYICHKAEDDELKDHIHLYIKPNTLLDTMMIQEFLEEPDPVVGKPRKCIDFHRTKDLDEWILYCQHYRPYLVTKGEDRRYCYTKEDFRFYDEDTFEFLYHHAFHGSKWAQRNQMLEQLRQNKTSPVDMVFNGSIPLTLASQLHALEQMKRTYRGSHEGHD